MKFLVTIFAIMSISFSVVADSNTKTTATKTQVVAGKIVSNGAPVANVAVELVDPKTNETLSTAQTTPDGKYFFDEIPEGKYTLKVAPETSSPKTFNDIAIQGQQTTVGDVDLATGHMLTAPGNFRVILSGAVYRGARPTDEGQIEWLQQNTKVKTIIDLQGADPEWAAIFESGESQSQRNTEQKWAKTDHGINWINKPLDSMDTVHCGEAQRINEILDIIRDPKNQPVYFHCEHGEDRTGLIAALFETFYETPSVTPTAAHAEMLSDGHSTRFCGAMDVYFNLATTFPMSLHKLDTPRCNQF